MEDAFERPTLTVDIVPLTVDEERLCVLLARRDKPPFAGRLALLGGFVHVDEDQDLDGTARRVLADKAGISDLFIEQLMTFSGRERDPRGWSASVAYFSLTPPDRIRPELGRKDLELLPVEDLPWRFEVHLDAQLARAAVRRAGARRATARMDIIPS